MHKRSIATACAIAAALAVGGIAGCATSASSGGAAGPSRPAATAQPEGANPGHGIFYQKLEDGYLLPCVYAWSGAGSGPSCDWPGHQAWLEKQQK